MEGHDPDEEHVKLGELVGSGGQAKVFRADIRGSGFAYKVFASEAHLSIELEAL